MSERTTSEVLRAALKLLGPNGELWVPGYPRTPTHCVLTALQDADKSGESMAEYTFKEANGIEQRLCSIIDWNDAPGRTWPEVRAAFERAIEMAEGEEQG